MLEYEVDGTVNARGGDQYTKSRNNEIRDNCSNLDINGKIIP
jgi:hypothetical protein